MDVSGCWEEMSWLTKEEGSFCTRDGQRGDRVGVGTTLFALYSAVRAREVSGSRVNVAAAWLHMRSHG